MNIAFSQLAAMNFNTVTPGEEMFQKEELKPMEMGLKRTVSYSP